MIPSKYQARRISKSRRDQLLKARAASKGIVLDSINGFILVEPVGSDLGDGEILSPEIANYELSDAWCLDPRAKLAEARRLLHLEPSLANGRTEAANRQVRTNGFQQSVGPIVR
jgi:hypothetical protein